MSINTIIVSGNVGKDCELRVTQNGKNLASFSIAVKQGYGEHEKMSWLNCRMFGKQAEALHGFIKKGSQLTVSGEYVTEEWDRQDGTKGISPTILVRDVQLPPRDSTAQQAPKPQANPQGNQQPNEPTMDFDDNVPF